MKGNGRTILNMEKVMKNFRTTQFIKGAMFEGNHKVAESMNGKMERHTRVNGLEA
jgi:hypothetical protein